MPPNWEGGETELRARINAFLATLEHTNFPWRHIPALQKEDRNLCRYTYIHSACSDLTKKRGKRKERKVPHTLHLWIIPVLLLPSSAMQVKDRGSRGGEGSRVSFFLPLRRTYTPLPPNTARAYTAEVKGYLNWDIRGLFWCPQC